MQHREVIVAGGASFVVGALAFVVVFGYLAAKFDYPKILDGNAAEVLPRLIAGGSAMRAVWAIYAFLPLFMLPGAVGAYFAWCFAAFFLLAGLSMRDEAHFPRWLGWCGAVFALLFFVGAFRNTAPAVQFVADLNNALLPLWMVVLGASLVRYSKPT